MMVEYHGVYCGRYASTFRRNLLPVTLKVKAAGSFEMSGNFRKIVQHRITEDRYTTVRI